MVTPPADMVPAEDDATAVVREEAAEVPEAGAAREARVGVEPVERPSCEAEEGSFLIETCLITSIFGVT